MLPEIKIGNELTGGLEKEIFFLAPILNRITNDRAENEFKKNALRDPTVIELTAIAMDQPLFIARAWHETVSEDQPARIQAHDFSFMLNLLREDMFALTEDRSQYRMTTREAVLLVQLGHLAAVESMQGN